ncbi:MAG: ComEC/Rec2 family competence protein, partial [Bacteroidales bacterium]|nr:ComEC/Rec2 family competence protein [Bacteroidales bacterium]
IIPTYGLLTNIIVIPLAFVILLCVILVLTFSAIPFVAEQIAHILNFVTDYLQDSIADITTFPHAQIDLNITQTQSVALYICIGLSILVLESWKQLQIQKNLTRL